MDKVKKREVDAIHKTLETADYLHGGELNVKQQKRFDQILRGTSAFFNTVEIIFVDQNKGEIPRLFIGGSITESAAEGTDSGVTYKPTFGKLTYDCKKLRTAFNLTHEWMINNVEQEGFKTSIMEAFFTQFSCDLSDICVNGDSASGDTHINAFDGFKKLSNSCHILDVNGKEIDRSVFLGAFKTMPYEFRRKKSALRYFANSVLEADWVEVLGNRIGGLSEDAVAKGQAANPHGIPLVICDEISDSLDVPYTSAVYGVHTGTVAGPFITSAAATAITIAIEQLGAMGADRALTVPAGHYTATQLAANLNAQLVVLGDAEVFTTDGRGHLRVRTVNTGAADSIEIKAVANHIYTLCGLTAAKYDGKVAGANTVPQGTYIWLTRPDNLIVPVLKGVRSSYEYVPRKDIWEFTMYNEACALIRNETAMVRVDNVKIKDVG